MNIFSKLLARAQLPGRFPSRKRKPLVHRVEVSVAVQQTCTSREYHKWGWQGECKIPKSVREKLEDHACSYRSKGKITVGKWTIQPWEEAK